MVLLETWTRRLTLHAVGIVAITLGVTTADLSAQTFQRVAGGSWMEPLNWGGTLPANDGSADLKFALSGLSTTLDQDWSIRSMAWYSGSQGGIDPSFGLDHKLTIFGGVTNASRPPELLCT